jgi:hypothetical protein
MWLNPDGTIGETTRIGPATPQFEDAFAALGRGALIATAQGPVAVEDLLPGTLVETAAHGFVPLLWVGAMTIYPDPSGAIASDSPRLIRIAADAFGPDRPGPDLVLGPRARLLYRHARCRDLIGSAEAFAPARAFVDGVSVFEVAPLSPVRVHHLGFRGQVTVLANGVEVESFHPGLQAEALMSPETRELFLGLFPHLAGIDGFGPMPVPRLTAFELESVRAA